jgi:hypothetical protein
MIRLTALCTSLTLVALIASSALAEPKAEKAFSAVLTDADGVETELKNVVFYWEERVSDTAFIPHELRQVPVKKGTATVHVKFDTIKQIDVKPSEDKKMPQINIALTNGKSGDFTLAIAGSFKGDSDFGDLELPASGLRKVLFK